MSKYTKKQLQEMAEEFLRSWNSGEMEAQHMMMVLSMMTGMESAAILAKANNMADYKE